MIGITLSPAQAANLGTKLDKGEQLHHGDYIQRTISDKSQVRLTMQSDGNLVLRNVKTKRACWSAKTTGSGKRAVYQNDGNFVVYNLAGRAVWASGKRKGSTVDINASGVLYVGYTAISPTCFS
ncbi:hypothetical protein [Micromonospora sp. Llam0]|uniref:hypothetical protein n=1 Tax=Micromonospora sp. Llam0 TaxID=2485143 RepID=UPI00131576F6|nr:hypothetical protein [Micromonospora sp. Llam0]